MPIFFHSQAHLWVFYALFLNGLLVHRILAGMSQQYRALSIQFEAQVILGFVFSLAINGLLLLALDLANLPFSLSIYILAGLTISLAGVVVWRKLYRTWDVEISLAAVALYAVMFIILFYNGGMIDQISDAWWHMSLANKIGWANSFTLEYGHLTGAVERYYPPLWHSILAMLRELSDQSIPIIWNAFTAWGAVLKLMAYYLMGSAIFKDRKIGLLSAVLFALLPGVGNSYLRVSAWPSHLAYILWFFAIFVSFKLIDNSRRLMSSLAHLMELAGNWVVLSILLLCLTLIYYLHQFEILLFIAFFFLFLLGLSVVRICARFDRSSIVGAHYPLYIALYRISLLVIIATGVIIAKQLWQAGGSLDYNLSLSLFVLIAVSLLIADICAKKLPKLSKGLLGLMLVVLFVSLDYRHFMSLFVPELSLPSGVSGERPLLAKGHFGGNLGLPSWHLQLRAGLLWSGFFAGVISLAMMFYRPSRAWLILSINSAFVWILCTSPYLYQWFTDALNYHSVWRFAILSLHPLIIAGFIVFLWRSAKSAFFGPSPKGSVVT